MKTTLAIVAVLAVVLLAGAAYYYFNMQKASLDAAAGYGPDPQLPTPNATLLPTINIAKAIGWNDGASPKSASGLTVNEFAGGLDHPRRVLVLPNGDVLVVETNAPPKPEDGKGIRGFIQSLATQHAGARTPSANRITLLRDADGDGKAEVRQAFIENLRSPFGMALAGDTLYVANSDSIEAFPYVAGASKVTSPGRKLVDLPAGPINHHWTKDLIASQDGKKLYVTVGSNSNAAENGMAVEEQRAAILEVDIATARSRVFATGLRNPNGPSWNPKTGELWVVVNERDELGSDLVPDYMTSVKDGGFYGWPYSYFGNHVDDRVQPQRPDLVAKAIVPDYALGPHTASLGLAFATDAMGSEYAGGAFVGQHGSWNRQPFSGYKVVFVPFADGKPSGPPKDILTGFLNAKGEAQGRPVGVAVDAHGALLVADDVGNKIWRVAPSGQLPRAAAQ